MNASSRKPNICCKDDPPGAYLDHAQVLGPHRVIEIDGGHETLFTHPDRVAKAILSLL